jgi:mRNA-degrading endonuclease YafQ of YafQ-DinJ toxin-antitoxin module
MQIEYPSPFKKSFRKIVSKRPEAALTIMQKVLLFSQQPNHPSLDLHKLKGAL